MNFKDLSKEKKQLVILGVMGVVVFIALGNQLVLSPAKSSAEEAKLYIEENEDTQLRGEMLLKKEKSVGRELSKMSTEILEIRNSDDLPPVSGKLLWAQGRIREIGYQMEMDLVISEHRQLRYFTPVGNKGDTSFWIPYSVDIKAQLTYFEIITLLNALHETEPYLSVGRLNIFPDTDNPQKHAVTMVIEWPVPRDEDALNALEAYAKRNAS